MVACSVGALTVYDMVKGIEPGVVVERVELLDKTGGKSDFHRHDASRSQDGHGRPIGDVRISVTDRCNFRCQYCMPAEGLPWLKREALLTYEEIARLVRAAERDGRARRPPHRRRAARAPRAVAARGRAERAAGRARPLADHERLPARPRRSSDLVRAGLRRVNVSLDSLAADRFFQLTRRDSLAPGAGRARGRAGAPRAAPDQGQRGGAARLHRGRGAAASPRFAREEPYEVRFIEFMPLDADQAWDEDKVLPNAEMQGDHRDGVRARARSAASATAPRAATRSPTAAARSASSPP